MDLTNTLNVKTLNNYIAATETIVKKLPNLKIQLNMSTVLNLKKVRSLEIEYFNKYNGYGAAFVVFEHMLKQPPSKTWGLLGKELVAMLQYWLDAVRRHLISHNQHWWSFLKSLLIFIKEINTKDPSLLSMVVELTTEPLLDLACNSTLDDTQRHQVLLTVNEFSAVSSREQRSGMKDGLAEYFVKLTILLSCCGHSPTQFMILEALLRWLVGRYQPHVREAVAATWFPQALFRTETVQVFLQRRWKDFYQDARDFLNSHNAHRSDLATSVVCKKLAVNGVDVTLPLNMSTWLDVNPSTCSVSVLLECRLIDMPIAKYRNYDFVTFREEDICSVQLYRANSETMLKVQTLKSLPLGEAGALTAQLARTDLRPLDLALRAAFADKYQISLNIDAMESSPFSDPNTNAIKPCPRKFSSSEDDQSPIVSRRRKHSGFIVRPRNQLSWNSPSSASTTSLAQLHDKLAALPNLLYNKEAVKVSVQPELSVVTEVSECEDRSSVGISQPVRSAHVGVCQRQSDTEVYTKKRNFASTSNNKPSLMLAATIGSTDEKVLRETYDKIYRNKQEVDLLDLLVKEALNEKDSGIITDKKTQETDVIENTPFEEQVTKKLKKVQKNPKDKCTIVSNSTTDDSNTEYLIDTPSYVNDRKRNTTKEKPNIEESKLLHAEAVEAFFSQHINENTAGQLVISPTLSRKINETSSEGSVIIPDLNKSDTTIEAEIIDCLNDSVDEVSRTLNKCTEISSKQQEVISGILKNKNTDNMSPKVRKEKSNISVNTKTKPITLRLQPAKKRAQRKTKQNSKQKKDENTEIDHSAIADENGFIENINTNSPVKRISTPLIRKKRKLYSPKDDSSDPMHEIPNDAKVQPKYINDTPIATCYKELEIIRQTKPRIRSRKRASTEPITSPRSSKLNYMFDKLKGTMNNNEEQTTQLDPKSKSGLFVYNYTSDSEDEDFKKKDSEVKKRITSTKRESTATKRGRPVKRVKYTESNNSSTDDESKKVKKRKVARQSKPRSRKLKVEHATDLIDERMRKPAPEALEVSFVKETPSKNKMVEPEPVIGQAPTMEVISMEIIGAPTDTISVKSNTQKQKKNEIIQIKKEKGANKTAKTQEMKAVKKGKQTSKKRIAKDASCNKEAEPDSPLPGLVVETEKGRKDLGDSVDSTMLQKFHSIYRHEQDVSKSEGKQNFINKFRREQDNACENTDVVNIDIFDKLGDEVENISTNKADDDVFEVMNTDQNSLQPEEIEDVKIDTVTVSDSLSEKTIPTDGKSPITGHNDFDELPPSPALLTEHIEHRHLGLQDMSPSTSKFFIELRDRLTKNTPSVSPEKIPTSPILPTRASSKEFKRTSRSSTKYQVSSVPKVVLDRMSSKTIQKYVSPSKSSVSTRCSKIVLQRISSDEINKWLTLPGPSTVEERPKRYNTRNLLKKAIPVEKTLEMNRKGKIKSAISPLSLSVVLNDINTDEHSLLRKENLNTSDLKSKGVTPLTSKEVSKEPSKKSDKVDGQKPPDVEKPLESKSSAEVVTRIENSKDKSAAENVKDKWPPLSEGNKSITCVNEWFKRDIATSSLSKDAAIIILERVMETLETTLGEIHQETGKMLTSMLLENHRCLNVLRDDCRVLDERVAAEIRQMADEKWAERNELLKEMMELFQKGQKERAVQINTHFHSWTSLMVQLLKEDLEANIEFNHNINK